MLPPVEPLELVESLDAIAPASVDVGPCNTRSCPTVKVMGAPLPVPVRFSAKMAPQALTIRSCPTLKLIGQALVRPESSMQRIVPLTTRSPLTVKTPLTA